MMTPEHPRFGVYDVLEQIGAGGMGVVYRAFDTNLKRPVAIKLLSDRLADPAARRRFQREAQMASSLNHPHIVAVHDAGEADGQQYLVTEFIDGGTLRGWAASAPGGWEPRVELLIGVADALGAAHQAGILHRDIKPENILITKTGYGKLADFGLAKLSEAVADDATRATTETRTGVVMGTTAYMSPEQALGRVIDARSDIFSFGIVLYELIAGRRPFEGPTHVDVLHALVYQPAPPLPAAIPMALRNMIDKALEKDPANRYQSMRDLVVDMRRVVRNAATADLPRVSPSAPMWRRHLPVWVAAAALVVIAAGAAMFLAAPTREVEPAGSRAYVQLTHVDSATQPALSPDGRMLAFVRGTQTNVPEAGMATSQIYVKLLPDGDPVQLTHDTRAKFSPRFSPDGARIAYSTLEAGFDVWMVPVIGAQEPRRLLTNAEGATWIRPQGNAGGPPRLLFSFLTGIGITMAVATATESRADERVVFEQNGVMDHFSYLSPDGSQLLLAEMGFNGWQPCRVVPFDGSSAGRKVGPLSAQCTGAAWSPDGKWMYFSADGGTGFHIWRQGFPDGEPEQVTSGASEEEGIEFTADGRSFLTSIGTQQSTLWVHDSRGDRQVSFDAYAFNASFSGDGRKLYYLVRSSLGSAIRSGALWITDLETGQSQRLLPDFPMEHYNVSRDGSRIVFVAANNTERQGVWVAPLDGGAVPRQLTSSHGLQAFWGAGSEVFFAAQEQNRTFVYRVNDDGSGLTQVFQQPVLFLYGVSPDGRHVAVWSVGPNADTANALTVYPVDQSAPTIVCGNCAYRSGNNLPQEISWSPDGKRVYFALMGGTAVFALPLRRGEVLPDIPPGGLRGLEDIATIPGATPFAIQGSIPGPNPSVYAYSKISAQRNIFRVPVP